MANLRIIFNNAADRAAVSSSTAASPSLGVANLLNDTKIECLRSQGTAQHLTITWPIAEVIGAVAFPLSNLTALATMRIRGYAEEADTVTAFDSGTVLCCPGPSLGSWDWANLPLGANSFGSLTGWSPDAALSSNAYAYGGGSCAVVWLSNQTAVKKILVTILDHSNPAGYVELSRLVCGTYWSPNENAEYGASSTPVDRSESYRNGGGDLITNIGTKHRKITVSLGAMTPSDRSVFWNIIRRNGTSTPVFFSLYPDSEDALLEQAHQVYGKFVSCPAITSPRYQTYASSIDLEEI